MPGDSEGDPGLKVEMPFEIAGAGLVDADVEVGEIELVLKGGGGGALIGLWCGIFWQLEQQNYVKRLRSKIPNRFSTYHHHCSWTALH